MEHYDLIHKWVVGNIFTALYLGGIDFKSKTEEGEYNLKILTDIINLPENKVLWPKCFTHSSESIDANYEKIEFLGDKIINLFHSEAIINNFNDLDERKLTNMVSHMQRNTEQAKVSRRHNLTEVLRVVAEEDLNDSIYSDVLEAIIGTLYYTSENAMPGTGANITLIYYRYLYKEYLKEEDIPDFVPKTEVISIIRDTAEKFAKIQAEEYYIEDKYIHILYISRELRNFFINFGDFYKAVLGRKLMIEDIEYGGFFVTQMLDKNRDDLMMELSNIQNLTIMDEIQYQELNDYDGYENIVIVPRFIVGFHVDYIDTELEYRSYNAAYENFKKLSITSEVMKSFRKKKSLNRFLVDADLSGEYTRIKSSYRLIEIEFMIYHKLTTSTSVTVSLIGIRNDGSKILIKTLTGTSIHEVKINLITH